MEEFSALCEARKEIDQRMIVEGKYEEYLDRSLVAKRLQIIEAKLSNKSYSRYQSAPYE